MTDFSPTDRPDLSRMRTEYMKRSLDESDVLANPIDQFIAWLNEAIVGGAHEPNAMTLATVSTDGAPSARIVLLKGVDEAGFVFFTNYLSRKGNELAANPRAAMVFYWPELERQVRIEGEITRTSREDSISYFESRPAGARVGSAASPQSEPVASRQVLEERNRQLLAMYPEGNVPCPQHWGGYCLQPRRLEFWQGRASRLHDRIEYLRDSSAKWIRRRLAP
jgi:pyridoxamine 5'-phosphate oxidase